MPLWLDTPHRQNQCSCSAVPAAWWWSSSRAQAAIRMQDITGASSPCFRQQGAHVPRRAHPACRSMELLQEPAGGDKPEQRFPEPVFALAAPGSMPCFPDTELLGGTAECLKPGLAAGLVSGQGHGSSQGLGGMVCLPALHSCLTAWAGLSHQQPCSGAAAAEQAQAGGNSVTCYITSLC